MVRFKSSFPEHQVHEDAVTLAPMAIRTANGNGDVFTIPDCAAVKCTLETSDFGVGPGDVLHCIVQTYIGGAWIDVCRFVGLPGNDLAKVQVHTGKITADLAEAMIEDSEVMVAGTVRNFIGTQWRARWIIGGGTATYTFSVKIQPIG